MGGGIGTAVGLGATALGGLMGSKGGKGGGSTPNINIQPSPYEDRMAQIAEEYWGMTSPLRYSFMNDFGAFMRPNQQTSSAFGGSGGGTTGSNVGQTTAPLSANFFNTSNIPSTGDIFQQLRTAGSQGLGEGQSKAAMGYLGNLGVQGVPVSSQEIYGQESPQYLAQLQQQAGDIRQNAMMNAAQQGMQSIANQQGVTTPGTNQNQSGVPSGYTSKDLYNPYNLPAYAPLYQLARGGIESQYGQARENIMASTPRGGALAEGLSNLEMGRAQQAGSLPAQIAAPLIQDIYNKAYGVAFGAPQTTLSGLGGADSGLTSRYNTAQSIAANSAMQQASLNQQATAGLGAGLGSLLGFGLKSGSKLWGIGDYKG